MIFKGNVRHLLWRKGLLKNSVGRRQVTELNRICDLAEMGRADEAEAAARAFLSDPRRAKDRDPVPRWSASITATASAISLGRGAHILTELDALIAEMREAADTPARQALLLTARINRTGALIAQHRYAEAEHEALDILRVAGRLSPLTPVGQHQLTALWNLAEALCWQDRYEEAEVIARGNLPRAEGPTRAGLNAVLVASLNGQKRYQEALDQARETVTDPSPADTGTIEILTAIALHHLGHHEEAKSTARQALHACQQALLPDHPRIQRAHDIITHLDSPAS